ADATAASTVADAVLAKSGVAGIPITVRAYRERKALVQGNGGVPPISVDSCAYWSIQGLQAESRDVDDHMTAPDTGSVVGLDGASANVTLNRLLARHPNRYKRSNVIRIGDGASAVTVEECELYDFHHDGIEASRSGPLVLARNYVNSRDRADL